MSDDARVTLMIAYQGRNWSVTRTVDLGGGVLIRQDLEAAVPALQAELEEMVFGRKIQ